MKTITISYKKEEGLRGKLLLWLLSLVIPMHGIIYRKRAAWNLQTKDLLTYPEGSLGRTLGLFLYREGLEPLKRIEKHDIFHILFDFSTNTRDESAMQFLLLGNGKISPFTLSTALFTAMILPEQWSYFYSSFRKGKKLRSVAGWDFYALLPESYSDLRDMAHHNPVHNKPLEEKIRSMEQAS